MPSCTAFKPPRTGKNHRSKTIACVALGLRVRSPTDKFPEEGPNKMKTTCLGVLFLAGALGAQGVPDVSKADSKHYKVLFENDQMRVVLVSYGAGEKSELLDHADALSIALSDRKERVTRGGSTRETTAKAGEFEAVGGRF